MISRIRKSNEDEGFTLIELLVVIVILGILAAIVVFAVGGITDRGNQSACKSDLKNVEVAQEAYVAKNAAYAGVVDDGCVALRPGVAELMEDCRRRGLRMAIATTTSRANVDALLRAQLGARWASAFDAVVCGEDVARKKPDPAVYVLALRGLGVDSAQALAIEDSPAGVAAARGAGIATLVTRSVYFADAAVPGALATGPGLHDVTGWRPATAARRGGPRRVDLDDLEHWHARHAGAPLMQPQPEHC